ncbi:hypothetical protein [Arthrobacter oryzae]|uniref:hypothetical protein n=1 Tax=Arthrobacter oryzae TaxID=409290 RepID=UPI0028594820|nr:hypothetical protein [Arthrobacter oryzae]MDR6504987.1 ABC-type glycerol-3-phosphate transport system substrate-binding protein [Arthrobacter oryzae]
MNRRKLSLAAAVVTATALTLTACSGGEAPAADTSKISIMAPFLEAQPPSADGAVQQKLEELTGKDVNIHVDAECVLRGQDEHHAGVV